MWIAFITLDHPWCFVAVLGEVDKVSNQLQKYRYVGKDSLLKANKKKKVSESIWSLSRNEYLVNACYILIS